ncbi:flavodoxin-like fold protein [Gregarina niphandrodes]|uniref:Flavodoxin-like fold protein n=1 Tax=Gregarina niphandrodes TaxID=110365 RepID=A0A023B0I6_GRENI|nr:flavodoxin-like fold protein [Gregarina niphandrodes]EZG44356.1 flavodoxin-like fold protein [Gregarina niphandrodes]|eukprot:XP_011132703.1 flavodoxin-like fold protein [Gregarina niphandrodes]
MFNVCLNGDNVGSAKEEFRSKILEGASNYADNLFDRTLRVIGSGRKVLVVLGGAEFGHAKGKLNALMADVADKTLVAAGCQVKTINCSDVERVDFNPEEHVKALLWAEVVILQFPIWWFSTPWIMKKWMDIVLTTPTLSTDGRSRKDPTKKYGSGGHLHGGYYMLSATWNAPPQAFEDPENLVFGLSKDTALMSMHLLCQFLGLQPLQTFSCYNVMKDPHVDEYITEYKEHLLRIFSN